MSLGELWEGLWIEWCSSCKGSLKLPCWKQSVGEWKGVICWEAVAAIQKRENKDLDRKQWEIWQNLVTDYFCILAHTLVPNMTIIVSTSHQIFPGRTAYK